MNVLQICGCITDDDSVKKIGKIYSERNRKLIICAQTESLTSTKDCIRAVKKHVSFKPFEYLYMDGSFKLLPLSKSIESLDYREEFDFAF